MIRSAGTPHGTDDPGIFRRNVIEEQNHGGENAIELYAQEFAIFTRSLIQHIMPMPTAALVANLTSYTIVNVCIFPQPSSQPSLELAASPKFRQAA